MSDQANTLLENYFASSQLGIAFTSPDKGWLRVNRRLCDMLGYAEEELRQLTWVDVSHPDDMARSLERFDKILAGEIDRYSLEKRFVRKNGEHLHADVEVFCARKADGKVDHLIATVQDITERKARTAELEATKERLQAALNAIPDLLFEVDGDGRIHDYRAHREDLLAAPPEVFMGKRFADVLPAAAAKVCQSAIREAASKGHSVGSSYALMLAQGERWFELSVAPMKGADGGPDRFIVLARDITKRKRAEMSLLKSQEDSRALAAEQRQILDTQLFGLAKFKGRRLVWANPGLEKMLGYGPGEAAGASGREHYPDEEAYNKANAIAAAMAGGGPVDLETRFLRRDGTVIWLAVRGTTLDAATGESLWEFIDITERKRYEAELLAARDRAEAASANKARFLAAASHDLWQPIQALNLFHDAFRKTEMSEKQILLSDKMAESVRSLADILSVLVDISRLDSGAIAPTWGVLPADELFCWIDSIFSPLALAKKLRFKLHFPASELALSTDNALLRSLLGNLIGNAIRYTERGGILVGVRRRGDRALIQVWDTGIGIPPEYIDEIFEEYFQIGNQERNNANGLGLGLSIVKRLSGLLEAPVAVRSTVDRGTVFAVSLPIAQDSARGVA